MEVKTIALKEETFQILTELKRKKHAESFDNLISDMLKSEFKIVSSMRGSLKGKSKPFSEKEREDMWKEK